MKRTLLVVVLLMVVLVLCGQVNGYGKNRGMVIVTANYLVPADKDFKDFYGSGHLYPELKIGFNVLQKLYLWAGYGFFSATGETPVLNLETKSTQRFLSAGLGYLFKLSSKFGFKGELGLFSVNYKEEAMDEEVSDSAMGFRLDAGLSYYLNQTIFLEISLGFLTASDTVNDISVKLGGFKTGIGLGIKF